MKDTAELIKKLGEMRNTTVIPMFFDSTRSIDYAFISDLYELLKGLPKPIENLEVMIHSSGGYLDAAYHAVILLRKCCKNLSFIVPRWAKSAATFMACGGNKIYMGDTSELGPLDPQIIDPIHNTQYSTLSIRQTIKFLDSIEREIREENNKESSVIMRAVDCLPLMSIGDNLRQLNHVAEYLKELFITGMFESEAKENSVDIANKIDDIIKYLVTAHSSHSKAILYEKAKELGLKVENMPQEQWEIVWEIYRSFEKEKLIKDDM